MPDVELHPRPGHPRCPYCLDALEGEAEVLACPDCGTEHHLACLREGDGLCATQGCGRTLLPQRARRLVSGRRHRRPVGRQARVGAGPRAGSERICTRCGARFEVGSAARPSRFCPGCRRSRTLIAVLAVLFFGGLVAPVMLIGAFSWVIAIILKLY